MDNLPSKNRLSLTDDPKSGIMKMCDGNPGGLNVLISLMTETGKIDPDSALGGWGCLFDLDEMGIYGSHIWILYKDVCGENLTNLVGLLRAYQLGFIEERLIVDASYERNRSLPIDDLLKKVREQLPAFAKA
jgi:hypothetical protein